MPESSADDIEMSCDDSDEGNSDEENFNEKKKNLTKKINYRKSLIFTFDDSNYSSLNIVKKKLLYLK